MTLKLVTERETGYIILGSTGCTCCREENFVEGVFYEKRYAESRVEYHRENRTVCSQYSKSGVYWIKEVSFEEILDESENPERIIIDNRVFDGCSFFETGEDIWIDLS